MKMNSTIKISLLFLMLLTSCVTMKQSINRNDNHIDNLLVSLTKENGNVFYIKSTNTSISTVWSYTGKEIKVYKLEKGKIVEEKEHIVQTSIFLNHLNKDQIFELDECMELDGDILGYRIHKQANVEQENFPINIDCFIKGDYSSDFLNRLAVDIVKYNLWNIKS